MTDSPYDFDPSDADGQDAAPATDASDDTTAATAVVDQENPAGNAEESRPRRRFRPLAVTLSCLAVAVVCAGITAYTLHSVEDKVVSVTIPPSPAQTPATTDGQGNGELVGGAIAGMPPGVAAGATVGMPVGGGVGATIRDCLDAGPNATDEEKEALADEYDFRVCTDQENAEFYQRLAEATPATPPTWEDQP